MSPSIRRSIAAMTRRENGPRCRYIAISPTMIRVASGFSRAQVMNTRQNGSRASGNAGNDAMHQLHRANLAARVASRQIAARPRSVEQRG